MEKVFFNKGYTDINPLQFGFQKCPPSHTWGPHIREYYLIHYVVSGKGRFMKKGFEHILKALLICRRQWKYIRSAAALFFRGACPVKD